MDSNENKVVLVSAGRTLKCLVWSGVVIEWHPADLHECKLSLKWIKVCLRVFGKSTLFQCLSRNCLVDQHAMITRVT